MEQSLYRQNTYLSRVFLQFFIFFSFFRAPRFFLAANFPFPPGSSRKPRFHGLLARGLLLRKILLPAEPSKPFQRGAIYRGRGNTAVNSFFNNSLNVEFFIKRIKAQADLQFVKIFGD